MVDNIDYSDLSSSPEKPSGSPKKSSINERKISASPKPKPVDTERLAARADALQEGAGDPKTASMIPGVDDQTALMVGGGLAALYGLYQAYQSRPLGNAGGPVNPPKPDLRDFHLQKTIEQAAEVTPTTEQPVDRMQEIKARSEAAKQAGLNTAPPAPTIAPQASPAGSVAPNVAPQFGPAGAGVSVPPAPPPTYGISETLATGGDVKQAIQQTIAQEIDKPLMTGTGKPAFAGTGPEAEISAKTGKPKIKPEYASMAEVPSGYALVPQGQYIDALRQDLGQAAYTKAFTGQDFPGTYEQAQAMGKDINRGLGRPTREAAKAAGLPPAEITPGITKMTSSGKKGVSVKGLGLAGALVAISDLAKADTKQQKTEAMNGLIGAILPPGMDIGDAGAGSTVTPQKLQNVYKLGSPLGQTEFAKRMRAEEEMARKIAGRTGMAVPPQYRR